ncbi:MAG: hypothetical protein IPL59_08705 [Candidatus Competibacteraceae bacterium]|nr:hypothetical protein [Candidatus Competibacteraceae bacterium]
MTQGIYRFDPDLYAALIETPLTGDLPDTLLYRLPEWGVYLENARSTYTGRPLIGVYAHLTHYRDGNIDLRLLLDSLHPEINLFPVPIRLGKGSLLDSIHAVLAAAPRNRRP